MDCVFLSILWFIVVGESQKKSVSPQHIHMVRQNSPPPLLASTSSYQYKGDRGQRSYTAIAYRSWQTYHLSPIAYRGKLGFLSSIVYRLSQNLSSIAYRLSVNLSSIVYRLSQNLSSIVYHDLLCISPSSVWEVEICTSE